MTKRAAGKFERRPRDFYPTPFAAVIPLLHHLPKPVRFHEPCVGDFALAEHLMAVGHALGGFGDIERGQDALELTACNGDCFITNPPWSRAVLHPMIERLRVLAPTWLLFDSDWSFTHQARPHLRYCQKIVGVGRVSWMGNGVSGFDNCAWYLFDRQPVAAPQFFPVVDRAEAIA